MENSKKLTGSNNREQETFSQTRLRNMGQHVEFSSDFHMCDMKHGAHTGEGKEGKRQRHRDRKRERKDRECSLLIFY